MTSRWRWWVPWLALMAVISWAEDYGIYIRQTQLLRRGELTVLNADVDYRFNPTAIAALNQGIPLTLDLELTVRRERPYWLDETILREQRRIQLRYHPLAKSFQIADLDSGIQPTPEGIDVEDHRRRARLRGIVENPHDERRQPSVATRGDRGPHDWNDVSNPAAANADGHARAGRRRQIGQTRRGLSVRSPVHIHQARAREVLRHGAQPGQVAASNRRR